MLSANEMDFIQKLLPKGFSCVLSLKSAKPKVAKPVPPFHHSPKHRGRRSRKSSSPRKTNGR